MPVKFKPILPLDIVVKFFLTEPTKEIKQWGDLVLGDFFNNVRTFKKKPVFKRVLPKVTKKSISLPIVTSSKIYGYIVRGTKPYTIVPKRASVLRFKPNYKRKTVPNKIRGRLGGSSGRPIYRRVVHHPGIKATNVDIVIAKKRNPRLIKNMKAAYKLAAKKSGHGIK